MKMITQKMGWIRFLFLGGLFLSLTLFFPQRSEAKDFRIDPDGKKIEGEIKRPGKAGAGESNRYFFNLPTEGTLSFRYQSRTIKDSYISLYMERNPEDRDDVLEMARRNVYGSVKSFEKEYVVSEGAYYLETAPYGKNFGSYALTVSFTPAQGITALGNGSFQLAKAVRPEKAETGMLTVTNSEDYYKVEQTKEKTLTFLYQTEISHSYFTILDAQKKVIRRTDVEGGSARHPKKASFRQTLPAGLYYVRVEIAVDSDSPEEVPCGLYHLTVSTKMDPKGLSAVQSVTVRSLSHGLWVKWAAKSGVDGYQIQYASSPLFRNASTYKVGSASLRRTVVVPSRGSWYVRVRSFIRDGRQLTYGKWSQVQKANVTGR